REIRVRDREGCTTSITSRRIVHMGDPHVAAMEVVLVAEDWSGPVEVRSALDGWVQNRNVERYRLLASRHLVPLDARVLGEDSVLLEVATTTSHIRIAEAARTRVFAGDQPYPHTSRAITQLGFAARDLSFVMPRNEPIRIE